MKGKPSHICLYVSITTSKLNYEFEALQRWLWRVLSVEIQRTFRRNILPPLSESKNKPSKKPAWNQMANRALTLELINWFSWYRILNRTPYFWNPYLSSKPTAAVRHVQPRTLSVLIWHASTLFFSSVCYDACWIALNIRGDACKLKCGIWREANVAWFRTFSWCPACLKNK
jgi:hypothetical protein